MKLDLPCTIVLALVSALSLSACSTANVRVMPGPDGTNRVVVRDIEKYSAEQEAFKAAQKYCRKRGLETIFLGDEVEYTGDMDEAAREDIRRASDAATTMAGIVRAAEADDSAVIFEGAAAVGRSVTSGQDYEAEVRFTCEAR